MPTDLSSRIDAIILFHGGLTSGAHGDCTDGVCAREARALAMRDLGLLSVISDHPDGEKSSPTDRAGRLLNDAPWSSVAARTAGCRVLCDLTEAEAVPWWVDHYSLSTIRILLSALLRRAAHLHHDSHHQRALRKAAERCARATDLRAAWAAALAAAAAAEAAAAEAAAAAAALAAEAALAAAALAAARAAAEAARAAAWAACSAEAGNIILLLGVRLLVTSHRGEDPSKDAETARLVAAVEKA